MKQGSVRRIWLFAAALLLGSCSLAQESRGTKEIGGEAVTVLLNCLGLEGRAIEEAPHRALLVS